MSLVGAVKGAHGLVVVSDSRRIVFSRDGGSKKYFAADDCPKLITFSEPHRHVVVGVCMEVKGPAALSFSRAGLLSEIEALLPARRLPVREYAKHVSCVLVGRISTNARLVSIVAGFDEGDSEGKVFVVDSLRPVVEHHAGAVGMTWIGGREFVDRLLLGVDARLLEDATACDGFNVYTRVPLATMSLQDCADCASFFVKTTMDMQRFSVGLRGVGGSVHVATITPDEGVQRTTVLGIYSAPGVHEIGKLFDARTETIADDGGLTKYTVVA